MSNDYAVVYNTFKASFISSSVYNISIYLPDRKKVVRKSSSMFHRNDNGNILISLLFFRQGHAEIMYCHRPPVRFTALKCMRCLSEYDNLFPGMFNSSAKCECVCVFFRTVAKV